MDDGSRGGDDSGGTGDGGAGGSDSSQNDGNERPPRNGNGEQSARKDASGKSGPNGPSGGSNGKQKPSTAEKAVMVVSVLVTLSLITYGGLQMVMTQDGATPSAAVVGTEILPNGDVAVTVKLTNAGDVGLISTTVEANCSTPPPSVELTYVPARSTRRATLVCPSGTTSPTVSVSNWVTA